MTPDGAMALAADTTIESLNEAERMAWRQWELTHSRLAQRLDQHLTRRDDMTLADYDVLVHLVEAEEGRLRMNELAERTRLSPSGLTRRFDALQRRGWVVRERCDNDRRGVFAVLTDEGRARIQQAIPGHTAEVRRYFAEVVNGDELSALMDMTNRILARLEQLPAEIDIRPSW